MLIIPIYFSLQNEKGTIGIDSRAVNPSNPKGKAFSSLVGLINDIESIYIQFDSSCQGIKS